jgi:hypothetical protein
MLTCRLQNWAMRKASRPRACSGSLSRPCSGLYEEARLYCRLTAASSVASCSRASGACTKRGGSTLSVWAGPSRSDVSGMSCRSAVQPRCEVALAACMRASNAGIVIAALALLSLSYCSGRSRRLLISLPSGHYEVAFL